MDKPVRIAAALGPISAAHTEVVPADLRTIAAVQLEADLMKLASRPGCCGFIWGDWACALPPHGDDLQHAVVWANAEDDIDPRLT